MNDDHENRNGLTPLHVGQRILGPRADEDATPNERALALYEVA